MNFNISILNYISWQKIQTDNSVLIIDEKRKISHELEGVVVDIWLLILGELCFGEFTSKHNCSDQEATEAILDTIRILQKKHILREVK